MVEEEVATPRISTRRSDTVSASVSRCSGCSNSSTGVAATFSIMPAAIWRAALGNDRYAAPEIVERNMREGHIGLTTGKGFLDYASLDREAYRAERDSRPSSTCWASSNWCVHRSCQNSRNMPRRGISRAGWKVLGTIASAHICSCRKKIRQLCGVTIQNGNTAGRKLRSRITTDGIDRAPHRAFMRGMGLDDAAMARPFIGVVTTAGETTPCNGDLGEQAAFAHEGIRAAGGTPRAFTTISVSDGISMNHQGMKCSLVSREIIANSDRAGGAWACL